MNAPEGVALSTERRIAMILRGYALDDVPYAQALVALRQAAPWRSVIFLAFVLQDVAAARRLAGKAAPAWDCA